MSKDWEKLRSEMEQSFRKQLVAITKGMATDLDGPVRAAMNRMTVAIRGDDAAMVEEIRDELELRLLEKKVELRSALTGNLGGYLGVGLNMLFSGAVAGLGAIKS